MYTFLATEEGGSQEVDSMIQALYTAIHNIFPTVPLKYVNYNIHCVNNSYFDVDFSYFSYIIRRIDVLPENRIQYFEDQERCNGEIRGVGPCGGFSTQYACMCDYHALPYREEVAWV